MVLMNGPMNHEITVKQELMENKRLKGRGSDVINDGLNGK